MIRRLHLLYVVFFWGGWGSIKSRIIEASPSLFVSVCLWPCISHTLPFLFSLLGWFEGPRRAVPVLQSCDVSCTSRWQSTRELPYLTDKDYSLLWGIFVLNSFFSKGTGGWKVLSSTIQRNLVAWSSDENCFVVQPFCSTALSQRALLGNGSFLWAPGKDWELSLSGPHSALGIEWLHLWCFCYTGRATCEQSIWICLWIKG